MIGGSLMKFERRSVFELVTVLAAGLVILFIIAPLAGLALNTSIGPLIEAVHSNVVMNSIWTTLWTSILATFIFSIFAVPFAYLMARKNFPFKRLVSGIIDLPVVIPHSAAGIALLCVISRGTAFGNFANSIGINFVDNPAGIMVGMAFVSLPYLINGAREGFESVPVRYEKAAYTLGASHARVFFTISLPLAWRSILSGFVMMWGRGLSEFGAVVIIAYYPMVASVLIYNRFNTFGLKYALPATVLFIIVCLILFVIFRAISSMGYDTKKSRY